MKTILILEIDYDPRHTDPEGLATAMDLLLETARSTPDILDEYGNPRVGKFWVAEPHSQPKAASYTLDVDGPLLRKQRALLLKVQDVAHRGASYAPQADERVLWEGIVGLLDEIADQAHDRYGIDCLLEEIVHEPRPEHDPTGP